MWKDTQAEVQKQEKEVKPNRFQSLERTGTYKATKQKPAKTILQCEAKQTTQYPIR